MTRAEEIAAATALRGTPSNRPDMTIEEMRAELAKAETRQSEALVRLRDAVREAAAADGALSRAQLSIGAWRGQIEASERLRSMGTDR